METVKTEVETSGWVDVFTSVIPFILLAIIIVIIVVIIFIVNIVKLKQHQVNSKITEQKLKIVEKDIQEIQQRLDQIEKT